MPYLPIKLFSLTQFFLFLFLRKKKLS